MNLKRVSEEAFCVDSLDIDKLKNEPQTTRTVVSTDGESFERQLVDVTHGGRHYRADVVTGTLYNWKGVCMSSDRLRLV